MTLGTIHKYRVKIGSNVSEFMHSNSVMPSIIQVLNIKSLFPKYFIHFSHFCTQYFRAWVGNINRELSPLKSKLHNLPCWSPNKKSTLIDTQYNFLTSVVLHSLI